MAKRPLVVLVDPVVDAVLVSTEDHGFVAVPGNVFVSVFGNVLEKESNPSVAPMDECHDGRVVWLECPVE